MNRIFGKSNKAPKPNLNDVTGSMEEQANNIEVKVNKLYQELAILNRQMQATPNQTSKNLIKNKALRLLKQKKMYEDQANRLRNQIVSMDSIKFATQSVSDTLIISQTMKESVNHLKKFSKKIDIDQIETLNDTLQDLIEDNNEIMNLLGNQHGMDDLDNTELLQEFDLIGEGFAANAADDVTFLDQIGVGSNSPTLPNVTTSANNDISDLIADSSNSNNKIKTDEFGLPLDNQYLR